MKILLVMDGDCYANCYRSNLRSADIEERKKLASLDQTGIRNALFDGKEDPDIFEYAIVDIPDETTDYIMDTFVFNEGNTYFEYLYYVLNGKIHVIDPVFSKEKMDVPCKMYKFDFDSEKYEVFYVRM